jgi:hypothetical protein
MVVKTVGKLEQKKRRRAKWTPIPPFNSRRSDVESLVSAILKYAEGYAALEALQRRGSGLVPLGDQKTGVAAEFFARLYAAKLFEGSAVSCGHTSQHMSDIRVKQEGSAAFHIQVKSVSDFSDSGRISPIKAGWKELWLFRLDRQLMPTGFWVLKRGAARWGSGSKKNLKMPTRGAKDSGSIALSGAIDMYDQLRFVLAECSDQLRNNLYSLLVSSSHIPFAFNGTGDAAGLPLALSSPRDGRG